MQIQRFTEANLLHHEKTQNLHSITILIQLHFTTIVMKSLRSFATTLFSTIAVASILSTQPAPAQSPKLSVTLEQAVKMSMESSKALHASQMRVDAADAKVRENGASMLPSLGFTGRYTRLSNIPAPRFNFNIGSAFDIKKVDPALLMDPAVGRTFQAISQATAPDPNPTESAAGGFPVILDNFDLRATLQYPVFTGFRLEANKAASELTAQATYQDLSKDKIETAFNTKNAYWMLYKARQFKRVTEETVQQAEAHVRDVQNMVKLGMMTNNDLLRLQVQLSNAKLTVIEASNNERLGMVSLNNMLGVPLDTELELATNLDVEHYQPSGQPVYEQAVQKALEARPDVTATELRVKAAEQGVRAANGGWLPQVSVAANAIYANPNQRFILDGAVWNATWDASLQLQWTIWNWNVSGHQAAQAEAQVAQVNDLLGQLKDGIKVEVMQNYLSLQQSREKIAVAKQTVEQSNENYRITNEKFKKGSALTSDLTDAETLQLQAKVSFISAVIDYEIAQARLAKSIGETPAVTGQK
jgi:outer membrane protein